MAGSTPGAQGAQMQGNASRWRKRFVFHDWLYHALGREWCGSTHVPDDMLSAPLNDVLIANTSNDGFELWIGYRHEWLCHMRHADAWRLVRFIVWTWWIKGRWCGVRRWAWYWALHRRVNETQRFRQRAIASAEGDAPKNASG